MKIQRRIYSTKNTASLSFRRKLSYYSEKTFFFGKILLAIVFIILVVTKQFSALLFDVKEKFSDVFADYGFVLENVVISGQKNIPNSDVIQSLNADVGTPIFSINLKDSFELLSKNSWIKSLTISRKLPDTIEVFLTEREPIAFWQINKELYLIDKDGEIIKNVDTKKFSNYIHIVGEDGNIYANQLISSLSADESLAGKVRYVVRVGQRRWDLNLDENIIVKMPQNDFESAYNYLIKMNNENKLFGNKVSSIDLRDSRKVYVEKRK